MTQPDVQRITVAKNAVHPLEDMTKKLADGMFQTVFTFMKDRDMSLETVVSQLKETEIGQLNDGNDLPVIKVISQYLKRVDKKYIEYDSTIQEAYVNVRLRFFRLLHPKASQESAPADGKEQDNHSNPLQTIIETIRQFVKPNTDD